VAVIKSSPATKRKQFFTSSLFEEYEIFPAKFSWLKKIPLSEPYPNLILAELHLVHILFVNVPRSPHSIQTSFKS